MALTRPIIFPLFLLSLLIIASANNYESTPTQNPYVDHDKNQVDLSHNNQNQYEDHHDQPHVNLVDELLHNRHNSNPTSNHYDQNENIPHDNRVDQLLHNSNGHEQRMPQGNYPRYQKEEHEHPMPEFEGNKDFNTEEPSYQAYHTKSDYGRESKTNDYQVHHEGLVSNNVNIIGIRGTILCKSGISSYTPIPGARAKITCPSSYDNGYGKAPFSISPITDEHGFYVATFPVSKLTEKWIQIIKECKVFPEYSPLKICNSPITNGETNGAYVSYSRTVGGTAYYNVDTIFYSSGSTANYSAPTNEPTVSKDHSVPSGGY